MLFRSFSLLVLSTMFAAPATYAQSANTLDVDIRKSLIVTELSMLKGFPLKRTMDQLAAQSAAPGVTGESLFRQWFDIMNPAAQGVTSGPHCDDQLNALGISIFNSFPFTCRPASKFSEGLEAVLATDPLAEYVPVTLTNRLDLAPANGGHCGEYRIVYARTSGMTDDSNRNFVIFEAALPNPHPDQGLKGCKQVVKMWAGLSKETDGQKRAKTLENFYYNGFAEYKPVVHIGNYGNNENNYGQLRTNQFMQPRSQFTSRVWSMREYKLKVEPYRTAVIVPTTVKTNPFGPLFKSDSTNPLAADFQSYFITQVEGLAVPNFSFNYTVPDRFNTGQAQLNGSENNYVTQFGSDSTEFGKRIQAELSRIGSDLTPTQVVARAQSLSCAGCHRFNSNPLFTVEQRSLGDGLVFPTSIEFTQTNERAKDISNGEESWPISAVLTELLLPQRKQVMIDYLTDKLKTPRNPADPIGGKSHH